MKKKPNIIRKSANKEKENKIKKIDEEDNKDFFMQGKPYKDKFNGKRLSKVNFKLTV